MKYVVGFILGGLISAGVAYSWYSPKQVRNEGHSSLHAGMNKLWAEHVMWTRQFIVSSVAGLADAGVAAERLMKNQDDIGAAIVPYYGSEAGIKLAQLLREHIAIAAEIVKAALASDNEKVKELDAKWHANASDIANFLSKANPNWTAAGLTSMFNEHLKLTTQELQLRMKADWKADVDNYDVLFMQAGMMGTDLADGIVKQFPKKF